MSDISFDLPPCFDLFFILVETVSITRGWNLYVLMSNRRFRFYSNIVLCSPGEIHVNFSGLIAF